MKKTPTLFIDDQVDDTLKDIAKKIGEDWRDRLVHKSVVLDGSLLAFKTQEEVLVSTVNTIKQLLAKGTQDTSFRHAIIDLFVWLVQHKRLDLLQGFPVVSRKVESELPFVISTLSTTARVLLPVELWQKVPGLFAEVFPQELILSSEYAERVPREGWEYFAENQFAYREPVYEEDTKLESQLIFSEESEYKEHVLETLQCSRIAHLELKDKGVIDRIRKSKPRALLFFKFLLTCVLETDSKWPQCIDVDCECGSKHSIFPSHWFYYVKIRKWVPSASGGSESLSPQSLAKLLENENDIVSKLKEDKPALLLNRFGIGIGELLRNIVTKGDDFKKLEWDKAFGAILTSGLEPRQLLAEFEEREKNREKVKANRELGRMIEQLFEATLQSDEYKCLGFKITRTGIGSDYEVEHDFIDGDQEQLIDLQCSTVKILVEIKSTVRPYVTMTHTQGKKASENEESFCLCVVPIFGSEPTGDIIRSNGRFVTNIGKLLKPKVAEVSSLQELTNETIALGGEIQIDISGSQVKYRINQTVWLKGVTFDEFIALLLARQQIS